MANAVDPTLIEEIVGIERHATEHYARYAASEGQTYVLHSAECLTEMGTPSEGCPYTAAQDRGIADNLGDWDGCEDQPILVDIDETDEVLTPRYIEIPENQRFPRGSRVRVKRDAHDVGDGHPGAEYTIESYVSKKHRDHPLPYYMVDPIDGDSLGYTIPHAALEKVMGADENAKALAMPEPEEVTKAISGALHSLFGEEISIHTTEVETEASDGAWPEPPHPFKNGVTFYGKTEGGRAFGGTIRLTALWQTDD